MVQRCTHMLPVIIPNGIRCKYTWGPVITLEIQQWMDKKWWTSSLHFTNNTNRMWKANYRSKQSHVHAKSPQRVWFLMTQWTVACQAPLSMRFSRHAYWSGLPCPPPGDLPDPGIEPVSPVSPALQADSLPTEPPGKPKPLHICALSRLTEL